MRSDPARVRRGSGEGVDVPGRGAIPGDVVGFNGREKDLGHSRSMNPSSGKICRKEDLVVVAGSESAIRLQRQSFVRRSPFPEGNCEFIDHSRHV